MSSQNSERACKYHQTEPKCCVLGVCGNVSTNEPARHHGYNTGRMTQARHWGSIRGIYKAGIKTFMAHRAFSTHINLSQQRGLKLICIDSLWTIYRPDYQRILADAAISEGAEFFFSAKVLEANADRGIVHLHDGRQLEADLVVGADGKLFQIGTTLY